VSKLKEYSEASLVALTGWEAGITGGGIRIAVGHAVNFLESSCMIVTPDPCDGSRSSGEQMNEIGRRSYERNVRNEHSPTYFITFSPDISCPVCDDGLSSTVYSNFQTKIFGSGFLRSRSIPWTV
jgi:hypothetical protein